MHPNGPPLPSVVRQLLKVLLPAPSDVQWRRLDYNDRVSSIKSYTGFSCIGVVQRAIVNAMFYDELVARAAGY
jgi:hypothetical protein